jgi:Protein of unknown function (DUF3435)
LAEVSRSFHPCSKTHGRVVSYDPSLVLSPHVALLGLIFADNAFLAPSLTSAERISELDIPPGYE